MIKIVDTYSQIDSLFKDKCFDFAKWEKYINTIYQDSSHIFKDEMVEYISTGKYTFEKDFLPIINNVYQNPKLNTLHESFSSATENLNELIINKFHKPLNVDIVLYLGLCNAAGWVTSINGTPTVLLGIEKIIELNWCDINSIYGLVYHELGHVYHQQHGLMKQNSDNQKKIFVYQLFKEGIAMYFEQILVDDLDYFHQDINGWKDWCTAHFSEILMDFQKDLPSMTRFNQRYFGDWCSYHNYSDTGYFLGCRFVQHLNKTFQYDSLINLDIDSVYILYEDFLKRQNL